MHTGHANFASQNKTKNITAKEKINSLPGLLLLPRQNKIMKTQDSRHAENSILTAMPAPASDHSRPSTHLRLNWGLTAIYSLGGALIFLALRSLM